jgi:predicted sulfurtransferase
MSIPELPIFSVCKPTQTLMDKETNHIISDNSDVIILDYRNEKEVLVCAYGNYRRSVVTNVSFLKPYPHGK